MNVIQVGGPLRKGALEAPRHQLDELCDFLSRGEVVHVVGPRQVGKSTLAHAAVRKLLDEKRADHAAFLDLQGLLDWDTSSAKKFDVICSKVAKELDLSDDYLQWLKAEHLSGEGKVLWTRFWEDFVLACRPGRLVLMIDELEELLPPPDADVESAVVQERFHDDFLVSIRAIHHSGSDDAELCRLTFCLIGSRPPAWLITNPTRTRMNVGRKLMVRDFTADEASVFLPHLERVARRPQMVLDEILRWTAGHPLLTAELARELVDRDERIAPRAERVVVQNLVEHLYLDDPMQHSTFVETSLRVLRNEPQAPVIRRLETYQLILELGAIDYRRLEPVHEALIYDGLAGLEWDKDSGDRWLVPRNDITREIFDLKWVRGLRRGQLEVVEPSGPEPPSNESLKSAQQAVDKLLAERYTRLNEGKEELKGTLFSFQVAGVGRVRRPLTLQAYRGLSGGSGADLWEQEVRALERLSGTNNPTLPVMLEAGFNDELDLAFTLTESAQQHLSDSGFLERIRNVPEMAIREFLALAHGLMSLQHQGLIHRNLWPGNIEILEDPERPRDVRGWSLRLARFEMSALLGNMLRRLGSGINESFAEMDELARDFFRGQGRDALACAPPERLAFVFDLDPKEETDRLESAAADVYSLGMIGFQLFVGSFPEELLLAAFPDTEAQPFSLKSFRVLHQEVRTRVGRQVGDARLAALLVDMLEWRPARRPRIFDVLDSLQRRYDLIQASFGDRQKELLLLAFMPRQTGEEFHKRGWMVHEPETQQGEEELWDVLRQDLRNARVTFSEHGAAPYVDKPDIRHKRAKYVLLGRRATYFGMIYEYRRSGGSISGVALPQVFLITFAGTSTKTWRLREHTLQRPLPEFKLVSHEDPCLEPDQLADRPTWIPLLTSVERTGKSPEQQRFGQALDWLLDVEASEQTIRQYAVTTQKEPGETYILQWVPERERDHFFRESFLRFYAEERPSFGDFFLQWNQEEGGQLLFEVDRWDARGSWRKERRTEVSFVRRLEDDQIQVKSEVVLPVVGWLRPASEVGSQVQLARQRKAREHLAEMPNLINQLIAPWTVRRRKRGWPGAGKGLRGRAGSIVRKMLDTRPLFALQGPPGTGKTTVTARAVAMALRFDRSQRILVSAQSHYALDNLVKRIQAETADLDVLALRIASESTEDRIEDESIKKLLPKHRVQHILESLHESDFSNLKEHPELMDVAVRWRQVASAHALEIQDRLRRGANILFSTTGTATAHFLGLEDERAVCDWAIVEEAGKAWPTELAIPMVQARRWSLIGDHLQLPPYGKEKIVALLNRCRRDPDPELQEHGKRREDYLTAFELFGSLLKNGKADATDRLETNYRMVRTIGDMISRAFYERKLETDDEAGKDSLKIERPKNLQGYKLIWLESGRESREEPSWWNPREVDIVKQLVSELMKNQPEPRPEQVAVLSPYRQQCWKLADALGSYSHLVHTVDSFQGKEADVVVVSLVRVNRAENPRERLGFLAAHNRINVMMSRARGTLILVGSYNHFKDSGVKHWETICGEVVTNGGGVLSWQGPGS